METFIYITNPEQALCKFYWVFKLKGSIILHKYNFKFSKVPKYLKDTINKISTFISIPANKKFKEGVLPQILKDIGF